MAFCSCMYVYMHVCMHVCVRVCAPAYMYVCMYVFIQTRLSFSLKKMTITGDYNDHVTKETTCRTFVEKENKIPPVRMSQNLEIAL